MSKGFEVAVPNDLKGKHPGMISEDIISRRSTRPSVAYRRCRHR